MDVGATMSNRDLVIFENDFQIEPSRNEQFNNALDRATFTDCQNTRLVGSSASFFQMSKFPPCKGLDGDKVNARAATTLHSYRQPSTDSDSHVIDDKISYLSYGICESTGQTCFTKVDEDREHELLRQYTSELGLPTGSLVVTLGKPNSVVVRSLEKEGGCAKSNKDQLTNTIDWNDETNDSVGLVNECQLLKHDSFESAKSGLPKYIQKGSMSSLSFDIFASSPSLRSPSMNSSTVSPCSSCLSICSPNDLRSTATSDTTPPSAEEKFRFDLAFDGTTVLPPTNSDSTTAFVYDRSCEPAGKKNAVCFDTNLSLYFNSESDGHRTLAGSVPIQNAFTLKQCSANSQSLTDLVCGVKKEYFWRYNLQAKGPKTTKSYVVSNSNPYVIRPFVDPVCQLKSLQRGCSVSSVSGAQGKLRKGDGNDITPNPMKLLELGRSIKELTRKSLSLNAEEKQVLKREKNRLASRSCRLKKKAQHEANKIKLEGLAREHRTLLTLLEKVKTGITQYVAGNHQSPYSLTELYDQIVAQFYDDKIKVAGDTDGYVSRLLESYSTLRDK